MHEDDSTQIAITAGGYDGPFDVLLALIRKNQYSIDDIPIVAITKHFADYLKAEKENMDPELAGQFVETASWLVLLKSRSLLPYEEKGVPSPRDELRRAVMDHATLAAAAEVLRDRTSKSLHHASAGAATGRSEEFAPSYTGSTVLDVLEAARRALETARAAASFKSTGTIATTVQDQFRWLAKELEAVPFETPLSTAEWFAAQPDHGSKAALLLAMLELSRLGVVLIHQPKHLTTIRLKALRPVPPEISVNVFSYQSESQPQTGVPD